MSFVDVLGRSSRLKTGQAVKQVNNCGQLMPLPEADDFPASSNVVVAVIEHRLWLNLSDALKAAEDFNKDHLKSVISAE